MFEYFKLVWTLFKIQIYIVLKKEFIIKESVYIKANLSWTSIQLKQYFNQIMLLQTITRQLDTLDLINSFGPRKGYDTPMMVI